MKLPSIVDVSDSETDDGEVELFMPSQANKVAAEVDYAQFFDPEHLSDVFGSPTFHGMSMPYALLPEDKLPGFHAADIRPISHQPSTTSTPVAAAETANSAPASTDYAGIDHAAIRPAAASAASAPAPRSTAVSTPAGTTPQPAEAAAPLLIDPGLPPPAAPAAAAPEIPVLSAPSILDDLDLDALLHRLSRTAVATGAAAAPHAPPVCIVANSSFINSPAKPSPVAAQPAANHSAAGVEEIVCPVYQPRWAKEAHGSTAGSDHSSGYQPAPANRAGHLVSRYAGPEGSSSNSSSSSSSSESSSTSDSPNKARLWVEPRPVIKVDLRSDTRDKNPGGGTAASSMQMPPKFGFGRAGRGAGRIAVGATRSGAPAVAAAAAVPWSTASATPAATVEADISDWWEGRAGGQQQHSESSDSEDEWLRFRQQHCKHRISQQQQQ